jgi:hypothetical protein
MKQRIVCITLALASGVACAGEPVREIEITHDPEVKGKTVYTVRMMPAETRSYDAITFECVYHQEFPWVDTRGRKSTKVHEPVTFKYRRTDVELVNDLDAYINFRVPTSREQLDRIYGPKVFNKDHPVTVAHIRMTAVAAGETVWRYDLAAPGKHNIAEHLERRAAKAAAEDAEEEGEFDLPVRRRKRARP